MSKSCLICGCDCIGATNESEGRGVYAIGARAQDLLDEATRFSEELRRIQVRIMESVEATNVGMESVLAGMETVEQGVWFFESSWSDAE